VLLLTPLACDLANLQSVHDAAAAFINMAIPLNGLILNAGVMGGSTQAVTADGFEQTMGVNHLGHFHLTSLLTDVLKSSSTLERPSRVVCVTSKGHQSPTRRSFGAARCSRHPAPGNAHPSIIHPLFV
jgi:NAD(P)-dependent dehydrogenase (short-subunit alcohol dehydrogenase family)